MRQVGPDSLEGGKIPGRRVRHGPQRAKSCPGASPMCSSAQNHAQRRRWVPVSGITPKGVTVTPKGVTDVFQRAKSRPGASPMGFSFRNHAQRRDRCAPARKITSGGVSDVFQRAKSRPGTSPMGFSLRNDARRCGRCVPARLDSIGFYSTTSPKVLPVGFCFPQYHQKSR